MVILVSILLTFVGVATSVVAADIVEKRTARTNPCTEILRQRNFSRRDLLSTVALHFLPSPTSRYDIAQRDWFRYANYTSAVCTYGEILDVPGRFVDIALGFREPDKPLVMDKVYTEVLRAAACVPAGECTEPSLIKEAFEELLPHLRRATVTFLQTWENVNIDWAIVGLHKQGSTSLARYMSLHPQLNLAWNTPSVLEHSIFTDSSRVLPTENRVAEFNNAPGPSEDNRCRNLGTCNETNDPRLAHSRDCLTRDSTFITSRGIKMLPYSSSVLQNPENRFLWADLFPKLPLRIIVAVTDPVSCFYSRYFYSVVDKPSVLGTCIADAVEMLQKNGWQRQVIEDMAFDKREYFSHQVEDPSPLLCAMVHNSCASSFILEEGCDASPATCNPDKLKVVKMEDLHAASYNRLVTWASHGKATDEFTPAFTRYNQWGSKKGKWVSVNGTRHPQQLSYTLHRVLEMSYTLEYKLIKGWLEKYGP